MNPKRTNIPGEKIIGLLRRGHVVRRACWQRHVYVRICNERGFDRYGHAIVQEGVPIYTQCTDGYFLHIGFSSQPFQEPHVFQSGGYWYPDTREGEGFDMFWANDWEDYGFFSRKDFDYLVEMHRERIREERKAMIAEAIERAKKEVALDQEKG